MIYCIITDRQFGKTTFAMKDIIPFYANKIFYYFSFSNDTSRNHQKIFNILNSGKNKCNFTIAHESRLRGVNLDYAIFDDYEIFSEKFRQSLLIYPAPINKIWFILCSGNDKMSQEKFADTIKKVRSVTANNNLTDTEKKVGIENLSDFQKKYVHDVVALPSTQVIYDLDFKEVKNNLFKKLVARERLKYL